VELTTRSPRFSFSSQQPEESFQQQLSLSLLADFTAYPNQVADDARTSALRLPE